MKHLIETMSIQTSSYKTKFMQKYVKNRINKMGLKWETDTYGNIYVTKGDSDLYPTMVCHIDTVHDINHNFEIHRSGDNLFAIDRKTMERLGIGGDDKVGVYITLELLSHFDNFKAVFFLDEEVGCKGSSNANFDFFNDSTIVLECDRKGNKDFVDSISGLDLYSEEMSNDIADILKHYNRTETYGGLTDVLEIAYNNDVCVANMSCGYYDPHSDNEYIVISQVEDTLDMCKDILEATKHKRYEIEDRNDTVYGGYNYYSYGKSYYNKNVYQKDYDIDYPYQQKDNFYTQDTDEAKTCPHCGVESMYFDDYTNEDFCINCSYSQKTITNVQSKTKLKIN